jgi:hypothetical protein
MATGRYAVSLFACSSASPPVYNNGNRPRALVRPHLLAAYYGGACIAASRTTAVTRPLLPPLEDLIGYPSNGVSNAAPRWCLS